MIGRHPEIVMVPYLCGELDAAERAQIEHHLGQCTQCRDSAKSYQSVLGELARAGAQTPEPDWQVYRTELRRKLRDRNEPAPGWWWSRPFVWLPAAAAMAGAAVLALAIVLRSGQPVEAPPVEQLAMEDAMAGADVGLLRNYPVVAHLDLLENYDVIEHLDQAPPAAQAHNESRS